MYLFEVIPPQSVNYTEIIKALFILIGAVVTGFLGICATLATIFAGAISEAWKERRAKKNPVQVKYTDSIGLYSEIFLACFNVGANPANNIERILFFRTINGVEKPRYVNCYFAYPPHKKLDKRYKKVPVANDAHYQGLLTRIQKGDSVWMKTETMDRGLLKTYYENEKVSASCIVQIDKKQIDDKKTEIWYMSIATYTGFNNNDILEIDLFVQFVKQKTGFEG